MRIAGHEARIGRLQRIEARLRAGWIVVEELRPCESQKQCRIVLELADRG
jgi:hypothetical protein